jgi:hypothetical protein
MSTVIPPPPCHQERAVTLSLPRYTYELARWAYRYERVTGRGGRTFAEYLVDVLENGLETPLARWQHEHEVGRRARRTRPPVTPSTDTGAMV